MIVGAMGHAGRMLHATHVESLIRPDTRTGRRVTRYLAVCRCGWSDGWHDTRVAAEHAAADHERVRAVPA